MIQSQNAVTRGKQGGAGAHTVRGRRGGWCKGRVGNLYMGAKVLYRTVPYYKSVTVCVSVCALCTYCVLHYASLRVDGRKDETR